MKSGFVHRVDSAIRKVEQGGDINIKISPTDMPGQTGFWDLFINEENISIPPTNNSGDRISYSRHDFKETRDTLIKVFAKHKKIDPQQVHIEITGKTGEDIEKEKILSALKRKSLMKIIKTYLTSILS